MMWTWWWLMEFIVLDVLATIALVVTYLGVVIRKAVV